ncbi:MAG: sulfite exporter TauE/SafE family protein [Rhodocyclaceae bacterium]|nr:sulfite exporter TauE/SafE family protein [Rhodocyclaceae bacterium]
MDFSYSFAGFAVGAIVGLTGVGGGSLMTPLLVLLFGVHPATAVGTDLLYAALTKAGGTWVHARQGAVDWRITGRLAAGSLPASALTLFLVHQFVPGGMAGASKLVSGALGVALLVTALALLLRRQLLARARRHAGDRSERRVAAATVATGFVLGVLVSISSVGAGAQGVAALFFLYPTLPTVRIVASDIAHAVPLTLVAGMGHWALGSVDLALLGSLLLGSLPGIFLGSRLSARVPEHFLRPALATMLVLVAGRLMAA